MKATILLCFSLLLKLISSAEDYYFENYTSGGKYNIQPLINTKYNSTGACVTMEDLIAFHMTDALANQVPSEHVFPENFCYGLLEYNITRQDFYNIVKKNINAFKNYRKLIPFYIFYNFTPQYTVMDDGCIGYLRLMSCYNEFPACRDNGDGKTMTVNAICSDKCEKFDIRCGDFYFSEFCTRQSKKDSYCPGKSSDNAWYLQINYKVLLLMLFCILAII